MKSLVSPPPVGQSFVDDEGVYWTVKNIIRGTNLDGFFLASLNHGKTPACVDGNMVLAPREYEALIRARGLQLIAPDMANPVRVAGAAPDAAGPSAFTLPTPTPSGSDALQ